MGFFDKIAMKAVDMIGDAIAERRNNSYDNGGNTSAPKSADTAAPAPSAKSVPRTPANVLASGNEPIGAYKTAVQPYGEPKMSFEIPESFTEVESHAEPEMCHLYMFDDNDMVKMNLNKPLICITNEDYAYNAVESFKETGVVEDVDEFEAVNTGKMLFRAKAPYYDGRVYFYGFICGDGRDGYEEYSALSVQYCTDVMGTPLEEKLMKILDHAAETYKEWYE